MSNDPISHFALRHGLVEPGAPLDACLREQIGFHLLLQACLQALEEGASVPCSALVVALSNPLIPTQVRALGLARVAIAVPAPWFHFVLAQVARRFPPGSTELSASILGFVSERLVSAATADDEDPWLWEALGALGDQGIEAMETLSRRNPRRGRSALALRHAGPRRWRLLLRSSERSAWAVLSEDDRGLPLPLAPRWEEVCREYCRFPGAGARDARAGRGPWGGRSRCRLRRPRRLGPAAAPTG